MPLNYPVLYKTMDVKGDAIVAQAVQTAIADAEILWQPEKFDGVFPVKGFGIRTLRPTDISGPTGSAYLGPTSAKWLYSHTTASTWVTWISNGQLSDSCYVVITGIFNYDASPDVRALKITADGVEYGVMGLDEMYGWDIATAYFSHPIVVRPEKTIKVEALADTVGQKNLGFLGYAIAKRSYMISKI